MKPRHLVRTLITFVVIATTACGGANDDPRAHDELVKASGQALFRGLVLRDGPVAELLPTVRDRFSLEVTLSTYMGDDRVIEAVAATRNLYGEIITQMETQNPEFFTHFRHEALSGDHEALQAAMAAGKEEMRLALAHLHGTKAPTLLQDQSTNGTVIAFSVAVSVAVVYLAAAVVQSVVMWNGDTAGGAPKCRPGGVACPRQQGAGGLQDQLADEEVVAEFIATTSA